MDSFFDRRLKNDASTEIYNLKKFYYEKLFGLLIDLHASPHFMQQKN